MAESFCIGSNNPIPKLTISNHQLPPLFRFRRRSLPRFSPKPSSSSSNAALVLASISSAASPSQTPPLPPPPRIDIVSSSERADGSIVYGFGEVEETVARAGDDGEINVGEEEIGVDAVEEMRGKESVGGGDGLCLSSVGRNEGVGSDCGGGVVAGEKGVEKAGDSDSDRTAISSNAVTGLGFVEGQNEYLDSGEDNGNASGSGSAMEKACDPVVVGYRDSVNDVATGSAKEYDGISSVEMVPSTLCSELLVASEVCDRPDGTLVEEISNISPNVESLQLTSCVENIKDDEDSIRLTTISASSEVGQVIDSVEDCLAYERTRSLDSETVVANAPSTPLEAAVRSAENGEVSLGLEVSEPLAVEMLATPILHKAEVPVAAYFLTSGAALVPHPAKALTGLEDAYFLTQRNLFGVADGAAQWSLHGIHAGGYASELMRGCETVASNDENNVLIDVKEVLKKSAAAAQSPGLAAVLVAHLYNQVLHVVNIGNTGFCAIRNGCICHRSFPMVHEFNFPIRIGQDEDPLEVLEDYHIDIEDGDVIVVGTDGLFDNLYDQEIVSIISESAAAGLTSEEIAKLLATRAQEVGRSASTKSPFEVAAKSMGYPGYSGGKLDAVSVIVSLVQRRITSSE